MFKCQRDIIKRRVNIICGLPIKHEDLKVEVKEKLKYRELFFKKISKSHLTKAQDDCGLMNSPCWKRLVEQLSRILCDSAYQTLTSTWVM